MSRWVYGAFALFLGGLLGLGSLHAATIFHYTFDVVDDSGEIVDSVDGSVDGSLLGGDYVSDNPGSIDGRKNLASLDFSNAQGVEISGQGFPFHDASAGGAVGDATLEFFIKGDDGGHQALFWTNEPNTDSNRFNIYWNGTGETFISADYGSPENGRQESGLPGGGDFQGGVWQHVAIVRRAVGTKAGDPNDGNPLWEWELYQNGNRVGGPGNTSEMLPNAATWYIAQRGCCQYRGSMDEVRASDAALEPGEFLVASPPPPSGEPFHLTFDENGGTDITDATDGSVVGTLNGGDYVSDTPGNIDGRENVSALDFSNAQGVMITARAFPFHDASVGGADGDATLEFFIKGDDAGHQALFWTNEPDSNRFNIYWNGTGETFVSADYGSPANERDESGLPGGGDFQGDVWHHVAIVRRAVGTKAGDPNDGNPLWEWEFYQNGNRVGGPGNTSESLPDAETWYIAQRGCCPFKGLMDEVRSSSSALTPGEFMKAAAPLDFNVHVRFEEGEGTDVVDANRGDIGDISPSGNGYSTDTPPNYTGGPGGDPTNEFSYDFSGGGNALVTGAPFALHKAQGDATLEWFAKVPAGTGHSSAFWTNGGQPGDSGQINLFFNASFAEAPNVFAFDYGGAPITGTPAGGGHWANARNAPDFPTDEWIHVAIVKTDTDGDGGNMYDWSTFLNGEEVDELFGQSNVAAPGENNSWGIAGDGNGGRLHAAMMDEIRLSDSALDPVDFLNSSPESNCPVTYALYSFEEGSGTDIVNSITGEVDGTLLSPDGQEGEFWSNDTAGGVAGSGSYQFGNNVGHITQTQFSLHRMSGDATLEWFSKAPAGLGHSSAFWTHGGQPGDAGNMNIFWAGAPGAAGNTYGGDLTPPQPISGTADQNADWAGLSGYPGMPEDQWLHLAIVKTDVDGDAGSVFEWNWYLDGELLGNYYSVTDAIGPGENNTWGIGGNAADLGRRYGGLLDEIRLTHGALSRAEFLTSPVTTHITFDEGEGTDFIDLDGTDIGDIRAAGNGYSDDVPLISGGCLNEYSYDFGGGGYGIVFEPFALHSPQGDATLEWFAKVPGGTGHTSAFWTNGGEPGDTGGQMNIFFNASFADAPNIFAFDYGGAPITGTPAGGGHWANAKNATGFPTDEWIHVAIVKTDTDGDGGNMYDWSTFLNGEEVTELFGQSDVAAPGENNSWGVASDGNGGRHHPAKMDEIRLSSTALEPDDFLYEAPPGEKVNPEFYWRFEDSYVDQIENVAAAPIGGVGFSEDVPNIVHEDGNNFSLDTGDGGSGLLVADQDKHFIFHANSGTGDATLEWFMKYRPDLGHSSPFFTHADANGGLPDNNRFNIFLGSCFGGGTNAADRADGGAFCNDHVTGDFQGDSFIGDHSAQGPFLVPNEWNHVAITRTHVEGTTYEWRTYNNHSQVGGVITTNAPMPENTDYWMMGSRGYDGLMDEVKGTKRALLPSQFFQFAPEEGDAHYRFEDVGGAGDGVTNDMNGVVEGILEGAAVPTGDIPGPVIYDNLNGVELANTTAVDLHDGGSVRITRTLFGLADPRTGDSTIEWFHKVDPGFPHGSLFWSRGNDDDANRFNIFVGATFAGNADGYGFDYKNELGAGGEGTDFSNHPATMPSGEWVHNAITRVDEGDTFAWTWFINGQDPGNGLSGVEKALPTDPQWQVNGRGCCRVAMLFDEYRQTAGVALAPDEFLSSAPPVITVEAGGDLSAAIGGAAAGDTIEVAEGTYAGGRMHINKDLTIRPSSDGGAAGAPSSLVVVEWSASQDWEATIQPGVAALYEGAATINVSGIHFRIDITGTEPSSAGGFQIVKVGGPPGTHVTFTDCIFEYTGGAPANPNVLNRNMLRHEGGNAATYNNCHFKWSVEPLAFPSFVNNIAYFVPGGEVLQINCNDCIFDNLPDTNGKMRSIGSGGGGGGNVEVTLNNCLFQEDSHGGATHQQAWISSATGTTHIQVNYCDFESGAGRFIGHEGNPAVTTTLDGCLLHPGGEALLPDPGAVHNIKFQNTVLLDAAARIRSATFCCENEARAYTFQHCTFVDETPNDVRERGPGGAGVFEAPNFADATVFENCLFNMPGAVAVVRTFSPTANDPIGGGNMRDGDSVDAADTAPGLVAGGDLGLEADGYHLSQCSPALGAGISAGVGTDHDGEPRPVGFHISFEEGAGSDLLSSGVDIGDFKAAGNGYSTDVPPALAGTSSFSYDFGGGGWALVPTGVQPFPLHAPQGDASLEWYQKQPGGQTHSSVFWTEAGEGAGNMNIFWGAEFAGKGETVAADLSPPEPIAGTMAGGAAWAGLADSPDIPRDTWFHMLIQRVDTDGGDGQNFEWRWFLDGVEMAGHFSTTTGSPPGENNGWHLCGRGGGPGNSSLIDDVKGSTSVAELPDVGADERPESGLAGPAVVSVPGDFPTIQAALAGGGACLRLIEVAPGDYDGNAGTLLVNRNVTIRGTFDSALALEEVGPNPVAADAVPSFEDGNLARSPNAVPFGTPTFGLDAHAISHLNDGLYGNGKSWIGEFCPDAVVDVADGNRDCPGAEIFAGIYFNGSLQSIDGLAIGRESTVDSADRAAGPITVQYTTDDFDPASNASASAANWTNVGTFDYQSKRQRFSFAQTVNARAVRVLIGQYQAVDEIELFDSGTVVPEVTVTWDGSTDWSATVQPGVAALYENAVVTVENIRFVIDATGASPAADSPGARIAKISGGDHTNVTFNNVVFEYTGGEPAVASFFGSNQIRQEGATTSNFNNCHIKWSNTPTTWGGFVNNFGYFVPGSGVLQANFNNCTFDSVGANNGQPRSIGSGGGGGGEVEVNVTDSVFKDDGNERGPTRQQAWISTATAGTTINATRCEFQDGADRFIGHEGNPNVKTNLDGCIFRAGGEAFLPDPGAINNIVSTSSVFFDAGSRFRSASFCCENEARAYVFRHCTFVDETPNGPVFTAVNFADATEFSNCLFNMPGAEVVVGHSTAFGLSNAPIGGGNMSLGGGGVYVDDYPTAGTDVNEGAPGLTVVDDLLLADDGIHLTECSPALGAGTDIGLGNDIDGEGRVQPDGSNPDVGADENSLDAASDACDFEAPTISCSSDVSVAGACAEGALTVNFDAPIATDNSDGEITVVCDPASGSSFSEGDTVVTCTATDEAGNSSQCTFTVSVSCGGTQRPGDQNQDGSTDATDQLNLLELIFLGQGEYPCDTTEANRTVLDANGDDMIDQSDAVYNLISLLLGGNPHVQGTECIAVPDCPNNASCVD